MKLLLLLLLAKASLSINNINANFMTYSGPTLTYCEYVPGDITLTLAIQQVLISLGFTSISQYFGSTMKMTLNHIHMPNTHTCTWTYNSQTMPFVYSDTNRSTNVQNNVTNWVFALNIANKARVVPNDPYSVTLSLFSNTIENSMRIVKFLTAVPSTFNISSATLSSTTALSNSCLSLTFTTNCVNLEPNTKFEFEAPNFNGSSSTITTMFSSLPVSCQNFITFPFKNTPDCAISGTKATISRMFSSLTPNNTFTAQICNVTAPPFGSSYPVTLYLTTSSGLRYASATFSVSSTEAPQLLANNSTFANEVVSADFDMTVQASTQGKMIYPDNFDLWIDFNDSWKNISTSSLVFTNLTTNADQYFFNMVPVSTGVFKAAINNSNFALEKGLKVKVFGIKNPSDIGNYKFNVQLKQKTGVALTAPMQAYFSVFQANTQPANLSFDNTNLNQLTNGNVTLKIPNLSIVNKMTTLIMTFNKGANIKAANFAGIEAKTNFSFTNYQISEANNQITVNNFFLDQPPGQTTLSVFKLNGIYTSAENANQVPVNVRILENSTERWNQNAIVNLSKVEIDVVSTALTVASKVFSLRINFNYTNLAQFSHNFRIKLPKILTGIANAACISGSNIPGYSVSTLCRAGILTAQDTTDAVQSILVPNLLVNSAPSTSYFIIIKGTIPIQVPNALSFALDLVSSANPNYQTDATVAVADIVKSQGLFNCVANCNICDYTASAPVCATCVSGYTRTTAGACVAATANSALAAPLILVSPKVSKSDLNDKSHNSDDDTSDDSDFQPKRGLQTIIPDIGVKVAILITSFISTALLNRTILQNHAFDNATVFTVLTFSHLSSVSTIIETLSSNLNRAATISQISAPMIYVLISLIVGAIVVLGLRPEAQQANIKSNSLLLLLLSALMGPSVGISLLLKSINSSLKANRGFKFTIAVLAINALVRLGISLTKLDVTDLSLSSHIELLVAFVTLSCYVWIREVENQVSMSAKADVDSKPQDHNDYELDRLNKDEEKKVDSADNSG